MDTLDKKFNFDSIDLRSIFMDVLRNLWVVILAALSVYFALTAYYDLTYKPEYTSSAVLCVNMRENNGASDTNMTLTMDMANVFTKAFESETLKKKIFASLGTEDISGRISVTRVEQTNLMTLNAVSDTGRNAYLIINSALENYDTVSDYLFSNARIDVLKKPSVPYFPSNVTSPSQTIRKGMLIAAVISLAAICIFSYLRSTVKNDKYAKKQLDGRIIGTLPYTKKQYTRQEKKDLLFKKDKPKRSVLITSFRLGVPYIEAVKRVSTLLEGHMRRRNQKVILVTSALENEGKSSVIANLALSFAGKGYRVLLIDADMKKPAMHKIFMKRPDKAETLSACILGKTTVEKACVPIQDNLDCLFQYSGVSDSEKLTSDDRFSSLLLDCRERYDYIFIDSVPMSVSVDAESMLQVADTAAIVVRKDRAEVGVINDFSDIIKQSKADFAGYILNAFRSAASVNQHRYSGYPESGKSLHSKKEEKA